MTRQKGNVAKTKLIALLHAEDYSRARRLGAAALKPLQKIVESGDWNLAAKGAYLAGLINEAQSVEIIEIAAKSRKPAVRAAAAAAAAHLSAARAEPILTRLLRSKDAGIRKTAIKAAGRAMTPKVRDQLSLMKKSETDRHLQVLVARSLESKPDEPLIA